MKFISFLFLASLLLSCDASLTPEKAEKIQEFVRSVQKDSEKNVEKTRAAQKAKTLQTVNKSSGVFGVFPLNGDLPKLQIRAKTVGEIVSIVRRLSVHFDVAIDNGGGGLPTNQKFGNLNLAMRRKSGKNSNQIIEEKRPKWTRRFVIF